MGTPRKHTTRGAGRGFCRRFAGRLRTVRGDPSPRGGGGGVTVTPRAPATGDAFFLPSFDPPRRHRHLRDEHGVPGVRTGWKLTRPPHPPRAAKTMSGGGDGGPASSQGPSEGRAPDPHLHWGPQAPWWWYWEEGKEGKGRVVKVVRPWRPGHTVISRAVKVTKHFRDLDQIPGSTAPTQAAPSPAQAAAGGGGAAAAAAQRQCGRASQRAWVTERVYNTVHELPRGQQQPPAPRRRAPERVYRPPSRPARPARTPHSRAAPACPRGRLWRGRGGAGRSPSWM